MIKGFKGCPVIKWVNDITMMLVETFCFEDVRGDVWKVPSGTLLNNSSIPKALWSRVGSPYLGKYWRAFIVHDHYVCVGNEGVQTIEERKKVNRMFYEACIFEGSSKSFAGILYLGVCVGAWWDAKKKSLELAKKKSGNDLSEDRIIQAKFDDLVIALEGNMERMDFKELESQVDKLIIE